MKVYVDGVFCCELENGATVSDIKSAVGMPCYAYARQKRYLTARQIFGWFGGKVVTRPQLAQVLQNLNINVDLTQLSYDWWDFLALGLHGTFDADVPLGQTMELGVPVNPNCFSGPVDYEIKNRYTYDHAVYAQEVHAFTRIGNTNLYLMSIPNTREPLFRVSPPSNYDVDVAGMLEKMILPPPEGALFYPDGRLQYRADTQELRDYVSDVNSLGGHYVVQGVECLAEFEGPGKYWGHDYPSAFALPGGGLVKKYRTYRAGAELLEPLPNIGATERMPECLLDVVGKGERRGSNLGGLAECVLQGTEEELTHFLATQDESTFSFKKRSSFNKNNDAHLAEVCCQQQNMRLTVFAVYGNHVEITQYGCGNPLALLKVKGCYEFLQGTGHYAFFEKLLPDLVSDKTTPRRVPQILGENGYVYALVLPEGLVPCAPGTPLIRGWPIVEMPPRVSRAAAASFLEKCKCVPKYWVENGVLTDNLLFIETVPDQGMTYKGEVVQII